MTLLRVFEPNIKQLWPSTPNKQTTTPINLRKQKKQKNLKRRTSKWKSFTCFSEGRILQEGLNCRRRPIGSWQLIEFRSGTQDNCSDVSPGAWTSDYSNTALHRRTIGVCLRTQYSFRSLFSFTTKIEFGRCFMGKTNWMH